MDKINFSTVKNNYPNLYQILNDYYGIDHSPKYDIQKLIEASYSMKHFVKFWKKGILNRIATEIDKELDNISFGLVPNYGAEAYFSIKTGNNRYRLTLVQFYLSMLNNVYTIQILEVDEIIDILPLEKIEVRTGTLKELWVSPGDHKHSRLFISIQKCLEELLENPIFLPYTLQEIELPSIVLPWAVEREKYLVKDAFFRTVMPHNSEGALICGDPNYMLDKLQ